MHWIGKDGPNADEPQTSATSHYQRFKEIPRHQGEIR
jgi:hypothetical protein